MISEAFRVSIYHGRRPGSEPDLPSSYFRAWVRIEKDPARVVHVLTAYVDEELTEAQCERMADEVCRAQSEAMREIEKTFPQVKWGGSRPG